MNIRLDARARIPWLFAGLLPACHDPVAPEPALADDIFAELGEVLPSATDEQRATFVRGQAVARRRMSPDEGLGPLVNVASCGACHERPVLGGSGPRYRDFYLEGTTLADGTFVAAPHGGVVTAYGVSGAPTRPGLTDGVNLQARRNPIAFFGVGLLAELPAEAILANEDPDDRDGDGISGRANYDRGFVGRFGRKSQTVSIEGFIRGPLNNHLGITTNPLTDAQKAALPVDSTAPADGDVPRQAAAPDEPLVDDDAHPDPELSGEDLFDLVSFSMLLAVPAPDEPTEQTTRGSDHFDAIGCADCHVRVLVGPRGGLPLYSDLLLHDMGDAMADGMQQNLASGREFRTQPLWGLSKLGPYLHDGRADTLAEAIAAHDGEAARAREAFEALGAGEQDELVAFLGSLGGQDSSGLLPIDAPIPEAGEPGAPPPLDDHGREAWLAGRELFDRNMAVTAGLGPYFNGDSCRACHFDPVIGGAGPLDVDVMRHGTLGSGSFVAPAYGTILHKLSVPGLPRREAGPDIDVFERRQPPSVLGLGLIDAIADATILAAEDPDDSDGDGISGVAYRLPDGRIGRFGWKAQVPSLREFSRDAMSAELGLTVPVEPGLSFGSTADDDASADPEIDSASLDHLTFFMSHLAPPVPKAAVPEGRAVFDSIGCGDCHTPELAGADGPVPLFSDLLLHQVCDDDTPGIVDGPASMLEFRTPPLWGLSDTAPYMHDASAVDVEAAIVAHRGEAEDARAEYDALSVAEREALLAFLEGL